MVPAMELRHPVVDGHLGGDLTWYPKSPAFLELLWGQGRHDAGRRLSHKTPPDDNV